MDPGVRTPFVDFFRRGEVAHDVRLLAARGAVAPRALEQLALLLILIDDPDHDIRDAANATLDTLPRPALEGFLARTDVPAAMREWFEARGITAVGTPHGDTAAAAPSDDPLIDAAEDEPDADRAAGLARLAGLSVMEKMKVAIRGTREERSLLIRDANRLVAAAVLSSPKLTENEIEGFARMANVGEEVLRVIATNRSWVKNYTVAANLVRNPKTPVALSLHLLGRLTERDVKMITTDRNVPEPLRIAARKRAAEKSSTR
jgi:hypothetical protein